MTHSEHSITWQSPSNIALIKYWGKRDIQIPCNPSISFTLSGSYTETTLTYRAKEEKGIELEFYLAGERKPAFEEKTKKFFQDMVAHFPFLEDYSFTVHSRNTFPHSTGIASSASGMSALALCLCTMEQRITGGLSDSNAFYQKASFIARLGSGSACRSLYGGLVTWGEIPEVNGTSNEYGSALRTPIHPIFQDYNDTILIVDGAEKKVSSRLGHGLMNTNPFSEARFAQAYDNMAKILKAIETGDQKEFIRIVETEALSLHAMMMTSDPYFMLFRPNTIKIIEEIWNFREQTGTPICFTLDAGPNVHVLYPVQHAAAVEPFIREKLVPYAQDGRFIADRTGTGPNQLK